MGITFRTYLTRKGNIKMFEEYKALTGLESGDDVVVSISSVEADDEKEFDEYEDAVETVDEGVIVPFDFLREAGFDFTKPLSISVCEGMINIEEVDEEEEDYDYE